MTAVLGDFRHAGRLLRRSPGFTLLAVLTLALGIGGTAAVFSVVDAVLFTPLPYPAPERLMTVSSQIPAQGLGDYFLSPPEYFELRQKAQSFAVLGAWLAAASNVAGGGEPERVEVGYASATLFPALGVRTLHGRTFSAAEDLPGGEPVALLGHGLWRRAFGGDPGVVGRRIDVDGTQRTVIGVMPAGFEVAGRRLEVWLPLGLDPAEPMLPREVHYLSVLGRLRPEVSPAAARAELETILARWPGERPGLHTPDAAEHRLTIQPMLESLVGESRPGLRLLAVAVGLVLLIACVNVANLLLARAEGRRKEVAVRTALGADRLRLLRQFLTESVLLGLLGGAVGLVLAVGAVRAIVALHPESLPRAEEIGLDLRAVGFTLGVSVLTGLLFGLAPAFHARVRSLATALKAGGGRTAGTSGSGRQLLRRALVVAEVALATVLVISGGLLIRSFQLLQQVDPGFDPRGVLSFQISLPFPVYPEQHRVIAFYETLLDRLASLPEVEAVGGTTDLPPQREPVAAPAILEGVAADPQGPPHSVDYWQFITRDYLNAMKIPLVDGRGFAATDREGTAGVVLVNQTMAGRFWPGRSAVGRRLRAAGAESPWLEVVGVVADVKQAGMDGRVGTELYFLQAQGEAAAFAAPRTLSVVVRTAGDPQALLPAVRAELRRLDPSLPLSEVRTLEAIVDESLGRPRFLTRMVFLFALVALALAAIGIYGVMASTVERRTQEIGVRMALGARARQVRALVLAQGGWWVAAGLALGVAGAVALRRVLAGVLYGVTPTDPAILGSVVLVLAAVALAACYLPARRATRVDPVVALRHE